MSADNGIYIAKFPDGYRVTDVVGCIENIDYDPPNSKERKRELKAYFGNSKVYKVRKDAYDYAWEVYDKWYTDEEEYGIGCPIEYGVSYIGEYESFEDVMEERVGEQFCKACGVVLGSNEKDYCDECKYDILMEGEDAFEMEWSQMELPPESYKHVGGKDG